MDEGVGHELWLELINGLLMIGAGFESEYAESTVEPGKWHQIKIVRHMNEAFVSVDGKKLSAKPMSLASVTLRFLGSGDARVRNLRLLDESTTIRPGDKAKDSTLLSLKGLPHLKIVDVSGSAVTDQGAAHLAQFKTLRWLDLRGTKGFRGTDRRAPARAASVSCFTQLMRAQIHGSWRFIPIYGKMIAEDQV